jgi:plastocyanin
MKISTLSAGNSIMMLFLLIIISACSEKIPYHSRQYTVTLKEMQFQPAITTASEGDTIIFINHDMVVHNVTEAAHREWTSSNLPPGQSWKFIVKSSAEYYCTIHPVMKGRIVLKR